MVSKRQPVTEVHVDQTLASATARVHLHLPPELVPSLLEHRFQIINLWRPIGHPAFDMPLTLCDFRTVDAARDLVAVARLAPERKGETYRVKWNSEHRWKYLKGMTPEEFVLIKWCVSPIAMYCDDDRIAASTLQRVPQYSHPTLLSWTRRCRREVPRESRLS